MDLDFIILLYKTIFSCMVLDIITNLKSDNNFFKQFTIWNLFSMFFNSESKLVIMNNIIIFILFYCCLIFEPRLMAIISKKCNLSVQSFHSVNVVLHILPFIYSIYMIYSYKIIFEVEDVLDNLMYVLCWQIYVNFDYSFYSISKQYYFNLYIIYFSCLGGLLVSGLQFF